MTGRLTYSQDILCNLDKTKQLVVNDSVEELKLILGAMKPVSNNLSSIVVDDGLWLVQHSRTGPFGDENGLRVTIKNCSNESKVLDVIVRHFQPFNKRLDLNVPVYGNAVLIELLTEQIRSVDLTVYGSLSFSNIRTCPFLTHLSIRTDRFSNFPSRADIHGTLVTAVKDNKLPALRVLQLKGDDLDLNVSSLFQCSWPTLTHLHIKKRNTSLESKEFESVSHPSASSLLPNLTSLKLKGEFPKQVMRYLFSDGFSNLSFLEVDICHTKHLMMLLQMCTSDKMPQLKQLCVHVELNSADAEVLRTFAQALKKVDLFTLKSTSVSLNQIMQSLSCHNLVKLVVAEGGLTSHDLVSLEQACAEGRLPQLTHLDISYNEQIIGKLHLLFGAGSRWDKLLNLDVCQSVEENNQDAYSSDLNFLCSRVESGCLQSLQKLGFTPVKDYFTGNSRVNWPSLTVLTMSQRDTPEYLLQVVEMVEQGFFPVLQQVNLKMCCRGPTSESLLRLRRHGIYVFGSGLILDNL